MPRAGLYRIDHLIQLRNIIVPVDRDSLGKTSGKSDFQLRLYSIDPEWDRYRHLIGVAKPAMKRQKKAPFDPKVFLSKVNGGRTVSKYRKNQVVYRQGEPADAVFYIQTGKAKKTVISAQGKEAVVAVLGAGDFFGERCLAGQTLRLGSVSALTECAITRIPKAEIIRVIRKEPAFAEFFISHLLARNTRVE